MNQILGNGSAPSPRSDAEPDMPVPDPGDYGGQPQPRPTNDPAEQVDEQIRWVVQGAHEGVDHLAEVAKPHVHQLHSQLQAVGDALDVNTEEWVAQARQSIREHPLGAVAAAVAVGLVLARIVR